MAEETQDGQKTLVSFVVGLLIGGMLVWAFSGPSSDAPATTTDNIQTEEGTEGNDSEGGDEVKTTETKETNSNGSNNNSQQTVETAQKPALEIGDGAISVSDQSAGKSIAIDSAIYPVSEGWVGVRGYDNEDLGRILGVVRFSQSQGLVPESISLVTPTVAGKTYAVVVFTENGDYEFNLANDVQIDKVFDTFAVK